MNEPTETVKPETRPEETGGSEARINMPLNLDNWKNVPAEIVADLTWFHQHALDNRMNWKDCAEALDYDTSTVFRILKGNYLGSWKNVADHIRSYHKIAEVRGTIQKQEFAENDISRAINAGLNYALANNTICLITGESRMGKTTCMTQWRDDHNHGRSVLVRVSSLGGHRALLSQIASAVGVASNQPSVRTLTAICRSFNRNRILLLDEAHNLLPGSGTKPVALEIVREIHDVTGCALGLTATRRFDAELKGSDYMYEQFLGRIGMPVRLNRRIKASDILPIVSQYLANPSESLMNTLVGLSNDMGRLGTLVEVLRIASRISARQKKPITETTIERAIAARKEMMGENIYAAK